jgi:hypothetical protein
MLQSGILTQGHGSWAGSWSSTADAINTGSAVPGKPFVNNCAAPDVCTTLQDGLYFQNEARNFDHKRTHPGRIGQHRSGTSATGCTSISTRSISGRTRATTTFSSRSARWRTCSTA